jgi:hypothetical protein
MFPAATVLSLMFWKHGHFSPFIGGLLSRPQDRWPDRFSHPFWGEYPYLLPCLVAAAYALLSLVLSALYLKEVMYPYDYYNLPWADPP